jgi:iron complex transport system substrate-binding protein
VKVLLSMARTRHARVFHALATGRRGVSGALLALSLLEVIAPLPAHSGESPPSDTSRIVSIGGAVTETIYALGLEGHIVGVDTTSLYPPEALKRAPNVGYMRALSAEGILSLKPSWVIAIEGSGPPDALKLVGDTGVSLTMIHDDPSPDGVAAKIETIGKLLGAEEKAVTLANETRARFALVEHMRPQTPKPPRVLFVLSLQNGRPVVGGHGTAADAMIRLAGGANAAGAMEGYKPMTDEGVIAAAPDVILKMNNANMVGGNDDIFSLPAFSVTPAAVNRALIGMDGLYLLGFGPRSPDAVRELMADLYPTLTLPALSTPADRQ